MKPKYLRTHSGIWKLFYRKEWLLLRIFLRGQIRDIQHIGSTAIPGMPARPIIDILVGIPEYEAAAECVDHFEYLGYTYLGENSELRKFYFSKGGMPQFDVFVLELSNEEWSRKIFLRDLFIQDNNLFASYARLKRSLAEKYPLNFEPYQDGKRNFIEGILIGNKVNP